MIVNIVPHPSPHNEERRLAAEYGMSKRFYSWAVGELKRQRRTLEDDDYETFSDLVESARLECENARLALRKFEDSR